jgi:hypothetical protein
MRRAASFGKRAFPRPVNVTSVRATVGHNNTTLSTSIRQWSSSSTTVGSTSMSMSRVGLAVAGVVATATMLTTISQPVHAAAATTVDSKAPTQPVVEIDGDAMQTEMKKQLDVLITLPLTASCHVMSCHVVVCCLFCPSFPIGTYCQITRSCQVG